MQRGRVYNPAGHAFLTSRTMTSTRACTTPWTSSCGGPAQQATARCLRPCGHGRRHRRGSDHCTARFLLGYAVPTTRLLTSRQGRTEAMLSPAHITRTSQQTFSQVTVEKSQVSLGIFKQCPQTFSRVMLESRTFSQVVLEFSHSPRTTMTSHT